VPVVRLTSEIVALAVLLACVRKLPAEAVTIVFPVTLTVTLLDTVPNCHTSLVFRTLITVPGSRKACVESKVLVLVLVLELVTVLTSGNIPTDNLPLVNLDAT
jgi:hypothetical protein